MSIVAGGSSPFGAESFELVDGKLIIIHKAFGRVFKRVYAAVNGQVVLARIVEGRVVPATVQPEHYVFEEAGDEQAD